MTQIERSYLVQRLREPKNYDNPFSFGGGLQNGGLSDDAMSLIRPIMSFDYMGAAEFEFGAVPKAFNTIARHKNLIAWSFKVEKVKLWPDVKECDKLVFAIAPAEWLNEIETRVLNWALRDEDGLKEPTRLGDALLPEKEWHSEIHGWLELDNGFMFFIDEEMWHKTAELFQATTYVP